MHTLPGRARKMTLAIQRSAEDKPTTVCNGSSEGMMLMVAGNTIKAIGAATSQDSIPRDRGGVRTILSPVDQSTLGKGLHGPDSR